MSDFYSKIQLLHYNLDKINLETMDESEEPYYDFSPSIALEKEERIGGVKVRFSIKDKGVSLIGECFALFTYHESLSEDDASSLIARNGLTILFPYLRSAITNFTTAANVEPIIIPTINILELVEEKFKQLDK